MKTSRGPSSPALNILSFSDDGGRRGRDDTDVEGGFPKLFPDFRSTQTDAATARLFLFGQFLQEKSDVVSPKGVQPNEMETNSAHYDFGTRLLMTANKHVKDTAR